MATSLLHCHKSRFEIICRHSLLNQINPLRRIIAVLITVALPGCNSRSGPDSVANSSSAASLSKPSTSVQFTDITTAAGLKFKNNNGAFGERWMPETVGSGAAFIDYDGDGYQDLYLANGRDWTDTEIDAYKRGNGRRRANLIEPRTTRQRSTGLLLRNNKNGTFSDVTKQAGLDIEMYGMGVAVGDYDNDGRSDLYLTSLGRTYLLHNEGSRFRDVTQSAGIAPPAWTTSAAWLDYNKDGRLDLFVCSYILWTPATDIYASYNGKQKSYVGPISYRGQPNRLYRNNGNGKFSDVSAAAGILKQGQRKLDGKALGVVVTDSNRDGWPDIVVANDQVSNFLFINNRNGTFREAAGELGIAYSESGKARAGMGIDAADIDHSGRESILIGNFADEMLGLYQNRNGLFMDIAPRSEIGRASQKFLTFGVAFLDYDNDTWPDMFVANGHVDREIEVLRSDVTWKQRPLIFHNQGSGRFKEVGESSGEALKQPLVARGLAYADIDLDGDLDVLFTTNADRALLLRNDGGNKNQSLRLVLQGTRSNRSGIGARIEAKIGTKTLHRSVRSGSSYLSQSELPLTLGLGAQNKVAALTVYWPSGAVTSLQNVAAGQSYTVNEDKGIVRSQPLATR